MNAAHDLLQSLRAFGWPIFAYAIFAPLPTYILPSSRSRQERTKRLLFVGVTLALIEVIFFVGTESNDITQVARLHPAWGAYVLLLALAAIGVAVKWAVARLRGGPHHNNHTPDRRLRRFIRREAHWDIHSWCRSLACMFRTGRDLVVQDLEQSVR